MFYLGFDICLVWLPHFAARARQFFSGYHSQTQYTFFSRLFIVLLLQKEIDEYEMSSKPQDFQSITSEVATVDAENKNNQEQLEKRRALLDCENARDFEILLSANIEISTGTKSREGMEEKIENLKKDLAKIGGSATAAQDLAVRKSRLDALRKKLSRFDGQHEERSRHINGLEVRFRRDVPLHFCFSLNLCSIDSLLFFSTALAPGRSIQQCE